MKSIDLFIFVDALGWELTSRLGFLNDDFERNRCETVFGYSSTCDPCILTGASPVEHGHFSFFVKATGETPLSRLKALNILPQNRVFDRLFQSKINRLSALYLGCSGYFDLYNVPYKNFRFLDYTEKKDIYLPDGILGGQRTIFEIWEERGRKWERSDWRLSDDENIASMRSHLEEGEIELGYLFTWRLDATMHRYGARGPEVEKTLAEFEASIRDLREVAERKYDEVRIHIFGDHGMADTRWSSDMMQRFDREFPTGYGNEHTVVWDSTMARFWFGCDQRRRDIVAWLEGQGDGRILSDTELESMGVLFPDRKYGEVFYLLPEGVIFAPSYMSSGWVTGMHGFHPSDPCSAAAWVSNVPNCEVGKLTGIFDQMELASREPNIVSTPKASSMAPA